jgi:hypothetical protein
MLWCVGWGEGGIVSPFTFNMLEDAGFFFCHIRTRPHNARNPYFPSPPPSTPTLPLPLPPGLLQVIYLTYLVVFPLITFVQHWHNQHIQ